MKKQHISGIKRKDLLLLTGARKFIWLEIPEEHSNLNFNYLLDFIDRHVDYGKDNKYGNAYYIIRKETNKLLGAWYGTPMNLRLSKREIRTIRSSICRKLDGKVYLKIPYKISYVFSAIINIVEKIIYDYNVKLSSDLEDMLNLTYGIAFYSKHIECYDTFYDNIKQNHIEQPGYKLKEKLNDDFHSECSIFNSMFSDK